MNKRLGITVNKRLGMLLTLYGLFLLACGMAGYLLTGETSSSSLFNGGVFGSLMMVMGLLLRQGRPWTMPAALSATAIFTLTFVWRGAVQWIQVAQDAPGAPSHVGVAILLSFMFVVSAVVLRIMYHHYRH